jgi:outer membrane biosynthesis protein TonB
VNDLSSEARDLLRAARSFDEPSASDAERVHASVLAKVGVAVGAGAALTAASTSLAASPAAVLGATVVKLGAAIVVAGGLATAGYVALRPPSPKPAAVVTEARAPETAANEMRTPNVAPSVVDEPAPTIAPAPLPAKAPRARPTTPPSNDRASRASRTAPDLEGEARLLEQADADLRRGDPHAALARLAEHAAHYPTGALREEREGVRVVALCRAGRESEGKVAAERFLARSPRSALATRIRAACGD